MAAREPTILATSGGLLKGRRASYDFGPLMHLAVELAEVSGRRVRWCHVGTATGDQRYQNAWMSEAGEAAGVDVSHLNIFPKLSADDLRAYVLSQDVVWVSGGSIENLLVLWRLHGLDAVFEEAWQKGIVLSGTSAGSICWHSGAASNLVSSTKVAITNGLAFVPFSNCVHYEVELDRRERYKQLISDGTLACGYGIDNGVGLLYRGTQLVEAVSEVAGRSAYFVRNDNSKLLEDRINPRVLPGAS